MRFTTKETRFVDYGDLEWEIKTAYGLNKFEITESPNDTDYTFDITMAKPLDEYQLKELAEVKTQEWVEHWRMHIVLQDLVNIGRLDPGTYVIQVSW